MTNLSTRFIGIWQRFFENPLIRRIVKNSGYLFSATSISSALSMLQGILVARLLGVAGFGILGAITMFTSVVNKFVSFRMSELVIKYVGQYQETRDELRAAALFKVAALLEILASLAAFGLVWLLSPLAAEYLAKDIHLQGWFILYGLILVANLMSESSVGLLQIFDHFRKIALLNVIQSLITLLLVVYVTLTGGGFGGVLVAYLAGKAFGALALSLIALQLAARAWGKSWWQAPINSLRFHARELTHFAVSTNISASLSLINKDSELLWVSFFRNPLETGYYKLALTLANIVQLPISPLPQATYPELSRETARKNWGNVRSILKQGSLLAGGYSAAATLGLLFFGQFLIRTLYTPEYLPAFPALLILLAGYLVANTFYWNRTALLSIGRADFPAKLNFALAVLKVVGVFLLVPTFGYLANASLMAGSYIVGVSLSVLVFRMSLAKLEKSTNKQDNATI